MKVLVLGVTGMLGSTCYKKFFNDARCQVYGTLRNTQDLKFFPEHMHRNLITNIDVLDQDALLQVFEKVYPDIVINCIGVIKQNAVILDPLTVLPINAMLPHRLVRLCSLVNARLIHISTDCVFSGRKGNYKEADVSDAEDLYGKSKFIGEIHDKSHVVTLRTSIIGHELLSKRALVEWFLAQDERVKGYEKAIFSGLPAVELVEIIEDFIISKVDIKGLYHVSAKPISKLDLMRLIAKVYGKKIKIISDNSTVIDRSLDSSRFTEKTGYIAPKWPVLISKMYDFYRLSLRG